MRLALRTPTYLVGALLPAPPVATRLATVQLAVFKQAKIEL
jgi:hypothetical protein